MGIYLTKHNIWKEVVAANFSDEHVFSCDSMGLFWKKVTNISQKTVSSVFFLEDGGSMYI